MYRHFGEADALGASPLSARVAAALGASDAALRAIAAAPARRWHPAVILAALHALRPAARSTAGRQRRPCDCEVAVRGWDGEGRARHFGRPAAVLVLGAGLRGGWRLRAAPAAEPEPYARAARTPGVAVAARGPWLTVTPDAPAASGSARAPRPTAGVLFLPGAGARPRRHPRPAARAAAPHRAVRV